jgi:hypothetical protein
MFRAAAPDEALLVMLLSAPQAAWLQTNANARANSTIPLIMVLPHGG